MATKKSEPVTAPAPRFELEVAAERMVARWTPDIKQGINFANEDLVFFLYALIDSPDSSESIRQLKERTVVNQLSARQVALVPGSYHVELARTRKPEVRITSQLEPSPSLAWIQDSPGSQVVIWGELDWAQIQRDVVINHQVNWDRDTKVSLLVTWRGKNGEQTQSWLPVPEKDHATLHGKVDQIELVVLKNSLGSEPEVLKSLFCASRHQGAVLEVLESHKLAVAGALEKFYLNRQIVETDTFQISGHWNVLQELEDQTLRLTLERDGVEVQPDPNRNVKAAGDWHFHGVAPGTYVGHLYKGKAKKPILSSSPLILEDLGAHISLMPVNETRAFAYWHIPQKCWAELSAKHGNLLGRVRCHLKIYQEYEGTYWLKPEFSAEINLDLTRDYYLKLPPDRLYKARITVLIDGQIEEPLTEQSQPCQLGRLTAGRNPISHKWQPQPLDHPSVRKLTGPKNPSRNSLGYLLLHLHAHLPFIADPVNFSAGETWRPNGYPQEWYPEAVRETYLPLLDLFETLNREGVDFKLSMDISPTLVAMMKSQRHAADVLEYLERLIQLARLEVERTTREEPHFGNAARMHLSHLNRSRELFLKYKGDIAEAFKHYQDLGYLELCTCVGSHAMLPLWKDHPESMRGQILAAAAYHESVFGRPSQGVWLPECAYTPGIENFLEEAGFRYIFSEGATVTRGDAPAEFGVNAPVYLKGSKIAVFPRDPETGTQVWSGEDGYPGDADYLEFHIRGGPFKYNRITDRRGGYKQPYNPDWADRKAASHAGHFVFCRNQRFEHLRKVMWKKPIVVAPYDAELFGHHWYEGPKFLYYLFKKLHHDQAATELATPSSYLAANATAQDIYASTSSWGANATFEKWMSGDVSWMYRHSHEAARALPIMVASSPKDDATVQRLLAQAARQLMLAMSSDLPFVISNGHFVDRMKETFFTALREFWRLRDLLSKYRAGEAIDADYLRGLELEQCVFPNLDPSWFSAQAHVTPVFPTPEEVDPAAEISSAPTGLSTNSKKNRSRS